MSFELLCLVVLAYLVFGPRKLPELARFFAKTMAEIRRAGNEFRYSLEDEVRKIELEVKEPAKALPAPGVEGAVARPDPAAVSAGDEAAPVAEGESGGEYVAEDEEQWYESDWEPGAGAEAGGDPVEPDAAAAAGPAPPAETDAAHEVPHAVQP